MLQPVLINQCLMHERQKLRIHADIRTRTEPTVKIHDKNSWKFITNTHIRQLWNRGSKFIKSGRQLGLHRRVPAQLRNLIWFNNVNDTFFYFFCISLKCDFFLKLKTDGHRPITSCSLHAKLDIPTFHTSYRETVFMKISCAPTQHPVCSTWCTRASVVLRN